MEKIIDLMGEIMSGDDYESKLYATMGDYLRADQPWGLCPAPKAKPLGRPPRLALKDIKTRLARRPG
ncbi:MAG: hypothetical protein PHN49_07965 [Candidatus Omnitrophica bacterium]|nr:hypothetical protein [Candidatus Omnitrophota bacterium]MDD5671560.1 hypothetical protein [Candidatus Omnitrophota bacterium]